MSKDNRSPSLKQMMRRASLTVEAALALPFFFLCMAALILAMNLYADYAGKVLELRQKAEKTAAAAAGSDTLEIIDFPDTERFAVFILPFDVPAIRYAARGRVRIWNGYDLSEEENGQEEPLVYVTEYESVYHTSSACTHLELSWEAVSSAEIGLRRKISGQRYHACEKCAGSGSAAPVVYISPQGDCWHNSASCSGLTRHVHLVKASEVQGRQLCSRCAASRGSNM